jgi:hypothetical protein
MIPNFHTHTSIIAAKDLCSGRTQGHVRIERAEAELG